MINVYMQFVLLMFFRGESSMFLFVKGLMDVGLIFELYECFGGVVDFESLINLFSSLSSLEKIGVIAAAAIIVNTMFEGVKNFVKLIMF